MLKYFTQHMTSSGHPKIFLERTEANFGCPEDWMLYGDSRIGDHST